MEKAERRWFVLGMAAVAAAALWTLAEAGAHRNGGSDLAQDHLSARAMREGASVYAPLPVRWSFPGPEWETATLVNDHPPPYVVALCPLGLLPYPIAFLALAAANLAAGVVAVALVAHEFGWSRRIGALVAAGVLVHPGTVTCVCVGNISLLLFLLIVLGWREYRRNREGVAGAWLGLAAAIKLYPGLLLGALVFGRSWRGIGAAATVVGVCWAGAALAVGFEDAIAYARARAPANAKAYVGHGFNLSVAGVAHRAFGEPNPTSPWLDRVAERPDVAEMLTWVLRAFVGLLAAIGLLRARNRPDFPDLAFAVLVPAMLLLSPLTWIHAIPMMALPVAILARAETRPRLIVLIACAAAMCLNDRWLAMMWIAATGENVPPGANLVLLAPTWGMVGVLLLAATRPRVN